MFCLFTEIVLLFWLCVYIDQAMAFYSTTTLPVQNSHLGLSWSCFGNFLPCNAAALLACLWIRRKKKIYPADHNMFISNTSGPNFFILTDHEKTPGNHRQQSVQISDELKWLNWHNCNHLLFILLSYLHTAASSFPAQSTFPFFLFFFPHSLHAVIRRRLGFFFSEKVSFRAAQTESDTGSDQEWITDQTTQEHG